MLPFVELLELNLLQIDDLHSVFIELFILFKNKVDTFLTQELFIGLLYAKILSEFFP